MAPPTAAGRSPRTWQDSTASGGPRSDADGAGVRRECSRNLRPFFTKEVGRGAPDGMTVEYAIIQEPADGLR